MGFGSKKFSVSLPSETREFLSVKVAEEYRSGYVTGGWFVSKQTMVPSRWGRATLKFHIKRVDKSNFSLAE